MNTARPRNIHLKWTNDVWKTVKASKGNTRRDKEELESKKFTKKSDSNNSWTKNEQFQSISTVSTVSVNISFL